MTRASVLVAIGGGLVGNVAGLLAGLCLRGLPLVQIPTTLLAMSDSCLSLKQGVNSTTGKNHFGLFKAPAFVWSHLSFLASLPAREIRAACCELIKNVLVARPDLITEVAALLRTDATYTPAQYGRLITMCLEIKSALLAEDALEKHDALLFEYGHTVGHALEVCARGQMPHGEAIGIGMVVEAEIASRLGWLSAEDRHLHISLLEANGSPTAIPRGYDTERLLRLLRLDNKRGSLPPREGSVDMVLLERPGQPHRSGVLPLTQVDEQVVRAALEACRPGKEERP